MRYSAEGARLSDAPSRRTVLGAAIPGALLAGLAGPRIDVAAAATIAAEPVTVVVEPPTGDVVTDTRNLHNAFAECKRRAASAVDIGGGRIRYTGVPTLELRAGAYAIAERLLIRYMHGFRLRGQGRWATRVVWSGAGYFIEIERSRAIEVSGMRVSGSAGTAVGPRGELQGLAEGSGFCRVVERRDDGVGSLGGNTLMLSFSELALEELHRGWSLEGDQMTDGVSFEHVQLRDVFEGWCYRNSQSVNHAFRHVEFLWGVNFDIGTVYQPRLDMWSGHPDVMDGAAVVLQSGGKSAMEACSFITAGPTFKVEDPPQDGSHLAVTNIQPWTLVGCSWELRFVDTVGDRNGLQRTAVILPKTPYPPTGNTASQSRFTFYGCDWYSTYERRVLFYLRNDHRIRVRDSRAIYLGTPARGHRVHCLVTARTATRPGGYLSDASTPLKVTTSTNDATTGNPHHVRQTNGRFS